MDVVDLGAAIPSRMQAEQYLAEAAQLNPGPWEVHSRYVALGAERIAGRYPALDPERAYVLGLLHDIGRRAGRLGMGHMLDGYRFLLSEGYPGAGRVCITHAFPVPGLVVSADPVWKGELDGFEFIGHYLSRVQYDDYDRLVQLCDALSLPSGFCLMEKRLMDVAMRYGVNEHTLARWQGYFAIKEHIERAISGSIYRLLPEVVENTFEWSPDGQTTSSASL